jgi:hypothetical protein
MSSGENPFSSKYKNQNLIMKKTLVELNSQGIVYERHTEWVSHLGLTQLRDCVFKCGAFFSNRVLSNWKNEWKMPNDPE